MPLPRFCPTESVVVRKVSSLTHSHDTVKGINGICPVIEYSGQFNGKAATFKMTSTCGHVMGVDFPDKYNNWGMVDPAQLFDCPIEKNEANPKMKMNAVSHCFYSQSSNFI